MISQDQRQKLMFKIMDKLIDQAFIEKQKNTISDFIMVMSDAVRLEIIGNFIEEPLEGVRA